MNFQSKDSESRMRPKFSARSTSATGQVKKPGTPIPSSPYLSKVQPKKPSTPIPASPYLTTTQLMAKIRSNASASVSDQITKVMEARIHASSNKSRGGTLGSGRPQSKSTRDFSDKLGTSTSNKDSTALDFNKDRNRIFARLSSFDSKSDLTKVFDSLQLAKTQLTSAFRPKKVNSSRASSSRKTATRSKLINSGRNMPQTADKSEPFYPPSDAFQNLGMGDTPALVADKLDSTDSKETLTLVSSSEPGKSILKMSAYDASEGLGIGAKKLKNRIVLSDEDMYKYESTPWKNGFLARKVLTHRPKSNKKVRFEEEVKVHAVPYEERGSTEWQHNLLLSREMMLQRFLSDPRLGLFPDIFGSMAHPVASMHEAFEMSPRSRVPPLTTAPTANNTSTASTRPLRPTPRFPRNI